MLRRHYLPIVSTLGGLLIGYVFLHPYTMLVYALMHPRQPTGTGYNWTELGINAVTAMHPLMLPMAFAFAFFGGMIGLLVGILLERRSRLMEVRLEREKEKAALHTLEQVMVTLAHHLLNANMIIGGKVRHCRKVSSDPDILASLEVIEEQGRKIDTVIATLRKTTEIKVALYTSDGSVKMLDIAHDLEEQMRGAQGGQ